MHREFPAYDPAAATPTRDALHGYAQLLGDRLKHARRKRKHWWHASLRPSLNGLTTGVIHAAVDHELELDLRAGELQVKVASGAQLREPLRGQSVASLAAVIDHFLSASGVERAARDKEHPEWQTNFVGYSATQAATIGRIVSDVSACMVELRALVREESSPIQLWPHHFDLSLLWLPGDKMPDQPPDNEEYADKQMNFGFAFGDEGIAQPYFYITAYPLTDAFAAADLPAGTEWKTDGFSGAVLTYARLRDETDPAAYLLDLWRTLYAAGKASLNSTP